ncbi:MAG TPA: carboxypeptidase-like regulatory domain-containing protein [Bryobacteraceae bacterium]|nr:carboxypeptidase-like regulatory domain-containing protein [Bryobacteraceae bacterium]
MMQRTTAPTTLWIAAGLLLGVASVSAPAASLNPLSGEILGQVKNAAGVAQMGATIYLYNRYDDLVRKGLSNEQGRFVFDALAPDLYSIRVVLASFVPAERRNISVLPSSENRLDINLTGVFSTIGVTSTPAAPGTLMTDDWKWVLRTSQATRPVLRFLPELAPRTISTSESASSRFSHTTGVLELSAGDGQSFARGSQQDLGTAFAIATSLASSARVQLSGNLSYAGSSGLPGAGIRTSFSRSTTDGSNPEVVVTMRQLYLTQRSGSGMAMGSDSGPVLRTMSLAFLDKAELSDNLSLDYGFDFQSVSYLDRINYASPFVRATFDTGNQGRVRVAFTSGGQPTELLARDGQKSGELQQDLAALALMPILSLSDSHVTVERTQNLEIGYDRVAGSRTYSLGAYDETVSNAAFMLSAPANFLPAGDLLPDLSSRSSIFNIGSYRRTGFTAGVKQMLGDHAEVAVAAGRTGVLTAAGGGDQSYTDSGSLRAGIGQGQRAWVTVHVEGTLPRVGTRIAANYGWTDFNVLMPVHLFVTQDVNQDIGVNVYIRQPLPIGGMPWRLEASAELRNLLAQGYLPMGDASTHSVLTNSPRCLRGGLNFIF